MPHRAFPASVALVVALLLVLGGPVRAQDASPAATPGVAGPARETILDAAIAALPVGRTRVAVDRWTLRPSTQALRLPAFGGPVIVAVDAGALTAREGGSERRVAAGDSLSLTGDAAVEFGAVGPDVAVAFVVYVVPAFTTADSQDWATDPLAHTLDYPIDASADALPGGSGRVLLERITLPPGGAWPAQEIGPLDWYGTGEGRIGVTLEGDRLPYRWKSGDEREFAEGEYLPFIAPGARITLRNADDGLVVVYHLTLTPDAPTAAGSPAA